MHVVVVQYLEFYYFVNSIPWRIPLFFRLQRPIGSKSFFFSILFPRRVLPAKRGGGEKRWIESLEERGTKRSFIYLLFLAQRLVFGA